MARHARLIGLLGALLALGAIAPVTGALASGTVAQVQAAPVPAAGSCVLKADGDAATIPAIGPSAIDVIDSGDCPGQATSIRPLTVTAVRISPIFGTGLGTVSTDGNHVIYNPTACQSGTDFVDYTISDGSGATATALLVVSILRPTASPVTDAPSAVFVTGKTIGSSVPLLVRWCGVPTSGSAVSSYTLSESVNGGASWAGVSSGTATAAYRNVRPGTNTLWAVRTTDTAKRAGSWAQSLLSRITSFQDNGGRIVYSSGWKTSLSSRYSGGREHVVTRKGATATLRTSNVRQFAIVASRGSGRGSFYVYVDGRRVSSAISQRATTTYRRILYVGTITGDTAAQHTIQIRTTSTARVDLDTILTLAGRPTPTLTITPPAGATYGGAPGAVAASATSGLPTTVTALPSSWSVCSVTGTAVTFNAAGTCTLVATHPADPSWNAATTTRSFAVAPRPLSVGGIVALSKTFDGTATATLDMASATLVGVVAGDDVSLVTTGATGTFADPNAGHRNVTVDGLALAGAKAGSYTLLPTVVPGTITKASQAVTFDSPRPDPAVKGGQDYTVLVHATSGNPVALTVEASPAGACTISDHTVSFPGSGSCTVLANQPGDNNWHPAEQAVQTMTIASTGSTLQTISFTDPPDTVYQAAAVGLTASATSGLPVTLVSVTTGVCTVTDSTAILHASGTCTIEAQQGGDATYKDAAPVPRSFRVSPKRLTATGITAADRTYDAGTIAALDTASAGLSGVINGDDVSLVTTSAAGAFADPNAGPGKTVTVTGLSLGGAKASSYTLDALSLTAVIAKRLLTVTADSKVMTYGSADPIFSATYGAFAGSETSSVIDVQPTCSAGSARDVSGSPYIISCTSGSDNNYQLQPATGLLTVAPKPVTVSFTAGNRSYDGTTTASISDCSIATILGGDNAICSHASAAATFDSANVGNRTATGTGFTISGTKAGNYTITAVNTTTASIGRANPSCTITGYTDTWNGGPHTATGTCLGVQGETLAGLNLTGTTHTNAGPYPADPWTFTDATGNYNSASGSVNDTINKASQGITFTGPGTHTYGDAPVTVSATASSGLAVTFSGQTPAVCSASGTTVTFLAGGLCMVRASQEGDLNHDAAPTVDQGFTVSKATLNVAATDQTITYPAAEPSPYPFTYGPFQNADGAGDLTTLPACDAATYAGNAGTFDIVCSGGFDDRYAFHYVDARLTVNKADQSITFAGTPPVGAQIGGSSTQTATSTSPLTVAVTIDASTTNGACSIAGSTVHYDALGICVLAANQAGDTNWNPASQVLRAFPIGLTEQTITFTPPADHPYGNTFTVTATADSGLTVTVASQTTGVCTVSGFDVTLVSTGTCSLEATQAGDATHKAATPVSHSLTATTRLITITAVTDSRNADGTTSSTGTPTLTSGSLAPGDGATYSQTFDSAAAGTGKILTPSATINNGATVVTGRYGITTVPATGTITPAAPDHIVVTPSTSTPTAGAPFTVNVTVLDQHGNQVTGYTGTVSLGSSDGAADPPPGFGFTGSENGTHTFTGVVLKTAGAVTVIASDGSISGSANVTVSPGAASLVTSSITASPTSIVTSGDAAITVVLRDDFGNPLAASDGVVTLAVGSGPGSVGAVTDNGDGTYSATYSSGSIGADATATITCELDGQPMAATVTIMLTP